MQSCHIKFRYGRKFLVVTMVLLSVTALGNTYVRYHPEEIVSGSSMVYSDYKSESVPSTSWSHTYHNPEQGDLIMITCHADDATLLSITYGGVIPELIAMEDTRPQTYVYAITSTNQPESGAYHALDVTWSGAGVGATSFSKIINVDPDVLEDTSMINTASSSPNFATSVSTSVTSEGEHNIIFDAVTVWNGGEDFTAEAGQVGSFYDLFDSPRGAGTSYRFSGEGTVEMGWSGGSLIGRIRHVVISVPLLRGTGVSASLGKSTDGWSGAVPVYGLLTGDLDPEEYPYARANVLTPAHETYYIDMTWDENQERFQGTILIGSWYGNGCVDPNVGTYTVAVELSSDPEFAFIDYTSDPTSFSSYITRRKSSRGIQFDYTSPLPIWENDHWNHTVSDFVIYADTSRTDTTVAIPFHPVTSSIWDLSVEFDGIPVSQGSASSSTDVWWWDQGTHTLYVQKASLGTGEVSVDLNFRSDTDLWATRFDRVRTNGMGNRLFYNGLFISNQHFTTSVYGGGHEHAGMQAESRAHSPDHPEISTDCMERVAVHVDDVVRLDSSGTYPSNIKWDQDQWRDWIVHEDNDKIILVTDSDENRWQQQIDTHISARRTQTIYSGEHFIKNTYEFTNNDVVSRRYPFVWQREPWIGTDRATNDRSRYSGDTSDVVIETRNPMSAYERSWLVSYDRMDNAAIAVLFQKETIDSSTYGIFADEAFISSWGAEWPVEITNKGTTESHQIGFEHTFASVEPGETVEFTFWNSHYVDSSWDALEESIEEDWDHISEQNESTFQIELRVTPENQGWNFVSFNLVPGNSDVSYILDAIEGSYERVFHYDSSDERWLSHVPGRPGRFNTLHTWDSRMGVWIKMNEDRTLSLEGTAPATTVMELRPGWNMVGLPSAREGNHGLPDEINRIGLFDPSEEYNIAYTDDVAGFVFEPGKGYWLYNGANETVTWTVEY